MGLQGGTVLRNDQSALQVIGFLRAAVAVLHDDLRASAGEGYSNKALAHVLFALGEMRVPFETVYPLVLLICDLLQARAHTLDVTCAPCSLRPPHCPLQSLRACAAHRAASTPALQAEGNRKEAQRKHQAGYAGHAHADLCVVPC